ncbi:hypothetical protein DPMN_075216 [Dreissena polymorpha]|uniref:Uncharacterized protein n=1 Tax=Dreissena polymorpha TaxID=45954 RepID=A0A9D3YL88_DREPO|nr:hypothetical protein DPMN_075216 [Dreissena polymorpha]
MVSLYSIVIEVLCNQHNRRCHIRILRKYSRPKWKVGEKTGAKTHLHCIGSLAYKTIALMSELTGWLIHLITNPASVQYRDILSCQVGFGTLIQVRENKNY